MWAIGGCSEWRPHPTIGQKQIHRPSGSEQEIANRLGEFTPAKTFKRSYRALYEQTVLQAPDGCDFDFLTHSSKSDK